MADTPVTREQVAQIERQIGDRARSDKQYLDQLVSDPVGTLLAAGIPAQAVSEVLAEEGLSEEEVQGYLGSFQPQIGRSTLGGGGGAVAGLACICTDACCCTNCSVTTHITGSVG